MGGRGREEGGRVGGLCSDKYQGGNQPFQCKSLSVSGYDKERRLAPWTLQVHIVHHPSERLYQANLFSDLIIDAKLGHRVGFWLCIYFALFTSSRRVTHLR